MLKVESVVCGYGRTAITGEITMEFEGLTLIYGPNGVGKSTFLKTIAGIIRPLSGEIKIASGRDVFYLTERIDVPEYITAEDYVLVFCALYGIEKQRALKRMERALDLFGIGTLANLRLSDLSQGQRRMVQLTIPYVLRRKVNLLDDPLVGIDRKNFRRVVKDLIREIAAHGVVVIADRDENFWDFVDRVVNFTDFSLLQ